MKRILVTIVGLLSINLSHAGEIKPAAPKERGVNEQITVQFLRDTWGYTFEMNGFYIGTAKVKLVPVTREAASTIRNLDKKLKYSCVLEDATLVNTEENESVVGGTFFVRDINCN